ncbi:MAG: hypothetical protein G01um101429_327 [Parcubacteria group bacterium Gr01-1014_29]|nr:MAG: hypothetical protein G01um101429_327 [Parcubacteria group bacterium Gr01-1014_29]
MNIRRSGFIALVTLAATFVAGWIIVSASNAEQITACVTKNGSLQIVGDGYNRNACRKNETLLSWNIKGEKGDKGDTGLSGVDGKNATELHLFDANGQDLGIYVGENSAGMPSEQPITFNTGLGVFFGFAQSGAEQKKAKFEPRETTLLFEQIDCGGDMFVHVTTGRQVQNIFAVDNGGNNPRNFPLFLIEKESASRTILSHSTGTPSPRCQNYSVPQTVETLVATEVVLPFTEPLAWPLEVRN